MPEFDEQDMRAKLIGYSNEELREMLLTAYKTTRLFAKLSDEQREKLQRIEAIVQEPSKLSQMPGIPGPDDIRKMME